MSSNIIHALDIGEHKIRCFSAILESGETPTLRILGFGETENSAMINGNITDLDRFKKLIKTTIEECELESSLSIDDLIIGIGGNEVKSIYTNKKTQIHESSEKVSQYDINELINFAVQSELPRSSSVINKYFLEFQIDEKKGITNPINQLGKELFADIHLLTVNKNFRETIVNIIEDIGKGISVFITEHEASYYSMKNPEEKIFATIDIGFKNTNISIYDNGNLMFTSNIELGGFYFISDLSHVINISKQESSKVLNELVSRLNGDKESIYSSNISVVDLADKKVKVPIKIALQIVEARMNEIAKQVVAEIKKSGYYKSETNDKVLEDGIIIIGGSANLTNFTDIFMSQMDIKAKIGKVNNVKDFTSLINKPEYNIVFGLFFSGFKENKEKTGLKHSESKVSIKKSLLNFIDKIF